MGWKDRIRKRMTTLKHAGRKSLLEVFLFAVYFGLISSYALVWRWLLRRGLMRSHGSWVRIEESTDTPGLFDRTV